MAESRPIRIVRRPVGAVLPAEMSVGVAPASGRYVANTAGTARALRLFVLYLAVLAAAYLGFLSLALTATSTGTRSDSAALVALTIVALALAIWGWMITLARAPTGIRFEGREIIVLERRGRPRRFVAPPALDITVAYRYPSGFLAREPTELVEATSLDGRRRAYLVARGLLSET
ncbi:MAG: hypothetical protein ACREDK_05630 [Thermoplasmata archaeon]